MKKQSAQIETHLFVSDFQIPEHDMESISAVLKFIPDLKPDFIHFVGDILDLTKLSNFEPDPYDKHNLMDEIREARRILSLFCDIARKANPNVVINFLEGNHEKRQLSMLAKNPQLADLEIDGEYMLSLSHLLGLKKLGIKWIGYYQDHSLKGNILVEHGDIARSESGATARAMFNRRGKSGFSGHTHRISLYMKTQTGTTSYWAEIGGLCNRYFRHPYGKAQNWQQGFAVGHYVKETRMMHPTIIPMFNRTFVYGGKVYRP